MLYRFRALAGAMLLVASSGCAMCNSEFDHDYAAYGGAWDRHDRSSGRVGSAFSPAGERVIAGKPETAGESQLLDESEPPEVPESANGESPDGTTPDRTETTDKTDQGSG